MVLVVPCSKIYPHIAPSEGRIISPRGNNINIFYSLIYITINILICCALSSSQCYFFGIHGNTELVAALKVPVYGNSKLTTFSCENF